jgi:predicted ATP-grasp superfamily ATP-dependent carboligase
MQIFVYEFITGGGMWSLGGRPDGSLLTEGSAMLHAVVDDAIKMGAQPITLRDSRLAGGLPEGCESVEVGNAAEHNEAFASFAAGAEYTLLIAPEFEGWLLKLTRLAVDVRAHLLSPDPTFIALASDKQATADQLQRKGVAVPQGMTLEAFDKPPKAPYPAVLKPNDGAGSQSIRVVKKATEARKWMEASPPWTWRFERLHPGVAASVSIISGSSGPIALAPCGQNLSGDGSFLYLGGETPLPPELAERARRLGLAAAHALPATTGYFGVDLLLGGATDGSQDVVIEVNPRLTTSYVGLRAACEQNLLQATIDAVEGREVALSFRDQRLEFDPDGTVREV